jgi:hypothetical protein
VLVEQVVQLQEIHQLKEILVQLVHLTRLLQRAVVVEQLIIVHRSELIQVDQVGEAMVQAVLMLEEQEIHLLQVQLKEQMVVQLEETHLTMLTRVVVVELFVQENLLQVIFQVVDPVVMVVMVQQHLLQQVQ